MAEQLGARLEAALGELLQRRTRLGLYAELVDGIGRGLDISSYPLLAGLARIGPATAVRLGREIGLDRSGTSRYASRLEAGGLLRRAPDPDDARGVLLSLTAEGEKVVAVLRARLADLLGARLAGWPPAEATAFVGGLDRFVRELRDGS
ncbi:MarR family transcriptional regulator [Frankia sp. AgB32]|uniref:MarR family winged helix-turn-helix transcriptional regulator n=1 Tax=Frankia sp. AgB32 TaxID=631119 RepID=UPI00200F670D|nr:MarR family transcriptional regulator [Frankia sp. AgB32]MCK9893972.1 MarR family transcriptional regulator [Frankia sp. AgB32]